MDHYSIGIEGTDSYIGGCTTWSMSRLIDDLLIADPAVIFHDYPYLIRLNPNIPYKTRGNGALKIEISTKLGFATLSEICKNRVEEDWILYGDNSKTPGLVIYSIPFHSDLIYKRALTEFLLIRELEKIPKPDFKWPKTSLSHIGAIAACFAILKDFTFEILAYRRASNFGQIRRVDKKEVQLASEKLPSTFSSFDYFSKRELITPSGPDPVFCGIRGENPVDLMIFLNTMKIGEKLSSATIFKTNQGTGIHTQEVKSTLQKYNVFSHSVIINSDPIEINGGHVKLLGLVDEKEIPLMFFEPTKILRNTSRELIKGDQIYVHGSVNEDDHGLSIHVEYISIIDLSIKILKSSPLCLCGKRMKSSGYTNGFKCGACSRISYKSDKLIIPRSLYIGQKIYASLSAQRHLTRPLSRLHRFNNNKKDSWVKVKKFRSNFGGK